MKEKQEKDFVREQIKNKPVNKKRVIEKVLFSALCGMVFALAACVVFAVFMPYFLKQRLGDTHEIQEESTAETDSETESIPIETETETETESESESESTSETELLPPVEFELSISDFQELQNQLYAIGMQGNKSIVTVNTVVSDTDWMNYPYETEAKGAGVIIEDTGAELLILTEHRVIDDASEISVTFWDDANVEAVLKKYDGNTGIAILSVVKEDVPARTRSTIAAAPLGNSSAVANGSIVLALGSPLGTNYSILTGNITSTNNEISTADRNYSLFTTDIVASANGSGVLVNVSGEIIGIVMQEYSKQEDEITLTAVEISDIKVIIDMLLDGKDIPYLGLSITTVTDKIAQSYGIPKGVYIKEVAMDSPAMRAGLQNGDVITAINGESVMSDVSYSNKLLNLLPEDTVEVTVMRKGTSAYQEIICKAEVGTLQ